nr:DNA helicase [Tanacetum cinerariifolium]
MAHFGGECKGGLKKEIVEGLIEFLDNYNALVQLFRTARDKYMESDIPEFKVKLYNVIETRQYEIPTPETIGAIVFGESSNTATDFDLIVEEHLRFPQRVHKLHPCYMSLQFPLLFVNGEEGYHKGLKLTNVPGVSTKGLYDAIMRGDRDGGDLGTRLVLSASFTGGPRYMYSHHLDVCHLPCPWEPVFFITFTCNTNWPEIQEYMDAFPELTPADRSDIVDRVFEKKVCDYMKFVRNGQLFGEITAELPDPRTDADRILSDFRTNDTWPMWICQHKCPLHERWPWL